MTTFIEKAKTKIQEEGILNELERDYGKPLFLVLTGSHHFGFPSVDSDYDVRGVYLAPTHKFLGLREKRAEPVYTYMSPDRQLDVSVDEAGHFFRLITKDNGNRVEWVNSPLVVYGPEDLENVKQTINFQGISKRLQDHYLHSARDLRKGTSKSGLKKDLYALRGYMVGIHLLETGIVQPNLKILNKEKFGDDLVNKMIKLKEKGEHLGSEGYDTKRVNALLDDLDHKLETSVEHSPLPQHPNINAINQFLINLRLQKDPTQPSSAD